MTRRTYILRLTLALAATLALGPQSASAAAWTAWNGTANWSTVANWSGGLPGDPDPSALIQSGNVTITTGNIIATSDLLLGWNGGGASISMDDGSLTVDGTKGWGLALVIGESACPATFTQSGGIVTTNYLAINRQGGGSTSTYNLDGGTLISGDIYKGPGLAALSILNLNGGTLQAKYSSINWIAPGVTTKVKAGGAIIDTQDYDVVINSALIDDGTTSNGGLRIKGSTTPTTGVLRLGAANTYTGDTNIDAGYLVTTVNYALPSSTVLKFNSTGTAVSRMDIQNTTQNVAGLESAAINTNVGIYGVGGTLQVTVAEGNTHTYYGVLAPFDNTSKTFKFVKSGKGTQILAGLIQNTGGVEVAAGTLQIGTNDVWAYLGTGTQYTVDSGAQLVFNRNADNTQFTNQSIGGFGDVVFRGQSTGYFTLRGDYTGTLSYTGKTIVDFDAPGAGATWYESTLWLEKDDLLPHLTVLDIQRGTVRLRASDVLGQTVAGIEGASGTVITADAAIGGLMKKVNVNVATGKTYTFAGVIGAGPYGSNDITLTKSGSGTQVLSGNNTYTGGTTISAGVLDITTTGALPGWDTPTKFSVSGGATLAVYNAVTDGNISTILGTGNFQASSALGFDTTSGDRTYSNVLGNVAAGALGLTKLGTGKLTLSNNNIYSGGTTILGGTLTLGHTYALGATTGNLEVNGSGATLDLAGFSPTVAEVTLTNGTISGSGALTGASFVVKKGTISSILAGSSAAMTKSTADTVVLSGVNTFSGQLTVEEGALSVSTVNDTSADGPLGNSANSVILGKTGGITGNLQYTGGTNTSTKKFTMASGGTGAFQIDMAETTLTLSGLIDGAGALTKTGLGTLTFSGGASNAYTGLTTVSTGELNLNKDATFNAIVGNLTVNGGTAKLLAADQIADTSTVLVSGGILDTNNLTDTVGAFNISSGSLNGTTGKITAATYDLNGGTVNSQLGAGAITVATGTTTLGSAGRLTGTPTLTVNSGQLTLAGAESVGTVTLNDGTISAGTLTGASFDVKKGTISSNLVGTGAILTKSTSDTVILSGENAYTGATLVNAGVLQIGNNSGWDLGMSSFTVAGDAKLVFSRKATAIFTNQSISGDGDVEFRGAADGFYSFNYGYGWRGTLSYKGKTIVNLDTGSDWAYGTLWLEYDDVMPHATVLDLQKGNVRIRGSQDLGQTVAGLTGNSGTLITTDWSLVQKLNLNVADGQTHAFAGLIGSDGSAYATTNLSLVKLGGGTQILSGANNYTGTTTVSSGKLLINGSISGAGGDVTVNGGTLGGSGSIARNLIVGASGNVAPGNSPGNLTLGGNVEMNGTYQWELGSLVANGTGTAGMDWDLITMEGGQISGTNPNINIAGLVPSSDPFWTSSHAWTIVNGIGSFGAFSMAGSSITGYTPGQYGTFDAQVAGSPGAYQIQLTWAVVPEPSTIVLLATGLIGLLAYAWKKRR